MSVVDDAGAQPRCQVCGILMRDDAGSSVCPNCGYTEPHDEVTMPPGFEGPAILGG